MFNLANASFFNWIVLALYVAMEMIRDPSKSCHKCDIIPLLVTQTVNIFHKHDCVLRYTMVCKLKFLNHLFHGNI